MRKHLYRGFYKCDDGDKVIKVNDKKIKGKWIIGWYVGKTCDSLFGGAYESSQIISENSLCWYEVVPETVCECIDLPDKNGKEIFESDIVVIRYSNGKICCIGDVQYLYGVYGAEWITDKKNKSMVGSWGQLHNLRRFDDDIINEIEVIGNVFENSELLEKK